jgi:hypothetical protein
MSNDVVLARRHFTSFSYGNFGNAPIEEGARVGNSEPVMKRKADHPRETGDAKSGASATKHVLGSRTSIGISGLVVLLALGLLAAERASADYIYRWLATSGSDPHASFRVADTAIADGLISAEEVLSPPGFSADTVAGLFTQLAASSSLAVDAVSGAPIYAATNQFIATNATDTLLISARSYFIPTAQTHPSGKGRWQVTHVSPPVELQLISPALSGGYMQFLVTSPSNVTFAILVSSNLTHWTSLLTNQTSDGVSLVTDPEPAVAPARFYRAAVVP